MFKSILIFLKTHMVATIVTGTAAIAVVATPVVVKNYVLPEAQETSLEQTETATQQQEETNEPLTFRIEIVEQNYPDGSHSKEYKVVPSYEKDFSEWTAEEKKAYDDALKEAARMGKENYDDTVSEEERKLKEAAEAIGAR